MERPVGAMKSIAFMNGVEKMVCDAGFACRVSLVVLEKVFNAMRDSTVSCGSR